MSYVPPKKNTQYIFYVKLVSQSSAHTFQTNPTLSSGDVTVSIDGAAAANLGTLPTVTPSGGKRVKVSLSAAEMNGDNIDVLFSDAAGSEWDELGISIQTVTTSQIDDLATQASVTAIDPLTSTETAQAVLNAVASTYNTSGTVGAKINAAATSSSLGAGAFAKTVNIKDASNNPVDGAEVWVSTDSAGSNVVASGTTDSAGNIIFMLDVGSYFVFSQRAGINFPTTGTALTVV